MTDSGDYGIVGGAYFVGRKELLDWLNGFLDLEYTKVEQVASAAAFCQLMDAMYPKSVAIANVKFDASHEYEYVSNFKILQKAFDKVGIQKHIDVPKLIKAKHLDNLEFLQWFKKYFDEHYVEGEEPYRARDIREKIKKAKVLDQASRRKSAMVRPDKENKTTNGPEATPTNKVDLLKARRTSIAVSAIRPTRTTHAAPTPENTDGDSDNASARSVAPKRVAKRKIPLRTGNAASAIINKQASIIEAEVKEKGNNAYSMRAKQLTDEMGSIVGALERERNELASKLERIRAACQEAEDDQDLAQQILAVLEETASSD